MAIQPVSMKNVTPAPAPVAVANTDASNDTKNIQSQITSKQQRLKKISSDDSITATEKEEKRRELQKEIDELNRKLELKRQEQEERAKEAAKKQEQTAMLRDEALKKAVSEKTVANAISNEEVLSDTKKAEHTSTTPIESDKKEAEKAEDKPTDMSVKDIQEMLSADSLIQKERVQEQVDVKRENTVNVIKAEISQDKLYGTDTSQKEAELKNLQEKENFWTDAQEQKQDKAQAQTHTQTVINEKANVVIDQI